MKDVQFIFAFFKFKTRKKQKKLRFSFIVLKRTCGTEDAVCLILSSSLPLVTVNTVSPWQRQAPVHSNLQAFLGGVWGGGHCIVFNGHYCLFLSPDQPQNLKHYFNTLILCHTISLFTVLWKVLKVLVLPMSSDFSVGDEWVRSLSLRPVAARGLRCVWRCV